MKYIELFKDSFPANITEKCSPENGPYICYSMAEGQLLFTITPNSIEVPADNEIWYTSTDENIVSAFIEAEKGESPRNVVINNVYENGKGIITFQYPVTSLYGSVQNGTLFEDWHPENSARLTTITLPRTAKVLCQFDLSSYMTNLQYVEVQETFERLQATVNSFPTNTTFDIKYNGTKSQWDNVSLECYWDLYRSITVHCTDGDVIIPATE